MWAKFAGAVGVLVVLVAQPLQGLPAGPGPAVQPPAQLGEADALTLPNLVPLPPYDVFVGPAAQPQGPVWSTTPQAPGAAPAPAGRALRFTTTIQNRGRYAFELLGAPWRPDSEQPDLTTTHAYQCVRFTGGQVYGAQRSCVRADSVGTLTWHAQHRHFHINGFGRYELRRDRAGAADMTAAGLVGKSQKQGWCVSDMWNWRVDRSAGQPGQLMDGLTHEEDRGWYKECTSPVLYTGASWRQGISPGWLDTYPARYIGQEIPLLGVGDGVYWIVTTINPKDNAAGLAIQETTWADNTSAAKIQIYAGGKKARLLAPLPKAPYAAWFHNPDDQPGQ